MKRLSVFILVLLAVLCTGCALKKSKHIPTHSEIQEQTRKELFLDTLPTDEDGRPVYPDIYAGDFFMFEKWVFLITDIDQVSEYQYLKDGYPNTEFREVKYSYNYLQGLLDEYEASGEMEPGEGLWIDCENNRAVVLADKEHLSEKREKYFDENIPLYFEELIIVPAL